MRRSGRRLLVLDTFQFIGDIQGAARELRQGGYFPGAVAVADFQVGKVTDCIGGAAGIDSVRGTGYDLAVGGGVEVGLFAAPDQQDPLAGSTLRVMDDEGLLALAVHVTRLQQPGEQAAGGLVKQCSRSGKPVIFKDAENDAAGLDARGFLALDRELHTKSPGSWVTCLQIAWHVVYGSRGSLVAVAVHRYDG